MIGARAAVAGFVVAITLGGSSTSWPQYRGDSGHSGWNQSEKTLSPTSVRGLRLAWKYPVNGAVESSVSVVGGIVYATSVEGSLVALRGSDGGRVWATQIAGGIGGGSPAPALSGGRLFITADSGDADVSLYAYDAAAGKLLWAADIGGMHGGTGGATTYGDTVFVHRYNLMAIDPATGEERWSQLPECFECNPAVASGLVLTMDDDSGGLQARAVSNGRLRWQVRGAGRFSSPVVAGNRVFSSSVGDGDSAVPEVLWAFSLRKESASGKNESAGVVGMSRFRRLTRNESSMPRGAIPVRISDTRRPANLVEANRGQR